MTVIVTILGLGRFNKDTGRYVYEEATYQWSRFPDKPVKTSLVQEALRKWFPEADILALATEEALEHTWPKVKPIGNVCFRKIPKGSSQNEFWKIYNAVTESLPHGARVILDFTHGLRSIPLITLLALVFLRAAGRIELEAVIYAAQDAKTPEGITPIFDLTPFLAMLDWASATNRFLETGDVRGLARITGSHSDDLGASIQHLQTFSSALQLHYPLHAGKAAQEALKSLGQVREKLPEPMKILEERLIGSIRPLAFTDQDSPERQVRALFEQILWYHAHGHYEKSLGLANEWVHLFAKNKLGHDIWSDGFSLKQVFETSSDSWMQKLKQLHTEIRNLRNNISHWQLKRQGDLEPSELENIPQKAEELIKGLGNLMQSNESKLPEVS
jgi:CRISPR-associated DxTHG motif protein